VTEDMKRLLRAVASSGENGYWPRDDQIRRAAALVRRGYLQRTTTGCYTLTPDGKRVEREIVLARDAWRAGLRQQTLTVSADRIYTVLCMAARLQLWLGLDTASEDYQLFSALRKQFLDSCGEEPQ
jgi:hypothetical protein